MARMPWLNCVAGMGLLVAIGCHTPPTNTGGPPPVPFPSGRPAPGSTTSGQTGSRPPSSNLPSPNMPSLSSDTPRISTPTGQGSASNSPARLKPLDPAAAAPQFNDWQAGQSSATPPAPQQPSNPIGPRPPQTTLDNRMPMGAGSAFAPPAPIAPAFPTQPPLPNTSFANPQNPAGAFPTANLPAAPSLTPTRMSPSTVYQTGLNP